MKTFCQMENYPKGQLPQAAACLEQSSIRKAKLSDIAPVFNLVQDCCRSGHFNDLCLLPPFQTSVALTLFSAWMFGKVRETSGIWESATLYVIRYQNDFAGFALVHSLWPSHTSWEISLMAIDEKYRGQGLGRYLLQTVLGNLQGNYTIECECLPQSIPMKSLLRSTGFKCINPVKAALHKNDSEKFQLSSSLH